MNNIHETSTLPILTKFEKTALLSYRIMQLEANIPPAFDIKDFKYKKNIRKIAEFELENGLIPLDTIRILPNKEHLLLK